MIAAALGVLAIGARRPARAVPAEVEPEAEVEGELEVEAEAA